MTPVSLATLWLPIRKMHVPSHHHMQAPYKAPLMVAALTLLQCQALLPTVTMVVSQRFLAYQRPLAVVQLHTVWAANLNWITFSQAAMVHLQLDPLVGRISTRLKPHMRSNQATTLLEHLMNTRCFLPPLEVPTRKLN